MKDILVGEGNVHIDRDVITSNNVLTTNCSDLNLDVYGLERLCADVYFNQAGVDRPVELSEARDKTNGAYERAWLRYP